VAAQGEFYVLTSDGRKLVGQNAAQVPINYGARLLAGPSGRVRVTLPDDSIFTMGPGTEFVLDTFVYDPATSAGSVLADITKGVFRLVTGKVARNGPDNMRIKVPVGGTGIRGTDVEFSVSPDGSGYIKLFSGSVELTPYDSPRSIILAPGQMITYENFTRIHGPMPIR